MSAPRLTVRAAGPDDLGLVRSLVLELAAYEGLAADCTGSAEELREALFAEKPAAEVLLGFVDGRPGGAAIYYFTFSTFAARRILYLEDLYVRPECRRVGLGWRLFNELAARAASNGCVAIDFSVLDWNEAAIQFYRKIGASPQREWVKYRVKRDRISILARGAGLNEIPPEEPSRLGPDASAEQKR